MSRGKWVTAGLIAAAVLFAAGWLVGHLTSTTGEAERQRWQEENRQLLGPKRGEWQRAVSGMMREAALASARANALADSAATREAARVASDAEAARLRVTTDSLWRLAEEAESADAAIPILRGLVASVTAERDHAIAQRDAERETNRILRGAVASQAEATGHLLARITADSVRIADLEGQLERAPKGDRWKLSLWGADIRPGLGAIYGADRDVSIGVGLFVTP